MELRKHPLMSYRSVPNWPPIWVPIDDPNGERLEGEVGILVEVRTAKDLPQRCFLFIKQNEKKYLGCLLFNDQSFCEQISTFLKDYYDYPIETIARLDPSHTL